MIFSGLGLRTERNMATVLDMGLGEKITAWLIHSGLSAAQLAERVGVSDSTMSLWRKNRREPRRPELVKLARAMACSLDYLADDDLDAPPASPVPPELVAIIQALGVDVAMARLLQRPEPSQAGGPIYAQPIDSPANKRRLGGG